MGGYKISIDARVGWKRSRSGGVICRNKTGGLTGLGCKCLAFPWDPEASEIAGVRWGLKVARKNQEDGLPECLQCPSPRSNQLEQCWCADQ